MSSVGLLATIGAASAETLMMPDRDLLKTTSEVVWGVTTQSNGTSFTIDFGDGTMQQSGMVTDRSYIAYNHTYATSGTFTATLTVGAESATVKLRVYDAALMSPSDLRNLNVNRAIENGLRFLWVSQASRAANFPAGTTTSWPTDFETDVASFVVLSFQNNGYRLPNSNAAPTGIYQKYIVQRAINFLFSHLEERQLNVQYGGHDPCVGTGIEAAPCVGYSPDDGDAGYSTAVVSLSLASSGALTRVAGSYGPVSGKSYGEVLQRLVNGIAWGQIDGDANCNGRGGWTYAFKDDACDSSDGSAVGWNLLALMDSKATGITVPAFVEPEFSNFALPNGLNSSSDLRVDGTFDYSSDADPSAASGPNVAKTAIGMQGLFFSGAPARDARVKAAIAAISRRWKTGDYAGSYGWSIDSWVCGGEGGKGCIYSMFNVFKAFKLYSIQTLLASSRARGPSPIQAGDWYAEYVDWLLSHQNSPTDSTNGSWQMTFSCCALGGPEDSTAMALVMLSPTALVPPDEATFSSVGLLQGTPLSTDDVTTAEFKSNISVTAQVRGAGDDPIPGTTVRFSVISGPNAGVSGVCTPTSCVSAAAGDVTWMYKAGTGVGTDQIQANVGKFTSNILKNFLSIWNAPATAATTTLVVDAADSESWNAVSSNGWLTVTPSSGSGAGSATVAAQANTTAAVRTATITLGGKVITVTQAAGGVDLTVTAVSGVSSSTSPGGIITPSAAVKNQGVADLVSGTLRFYLSANSTFDGSDQLLGSTSVSAISAGATVNSALPVTVPRSQAAGNYYVVACVENRSGGETDTSNDCESAAFTVVTETVDLTVTGVSGLSSPLAGGTITPTAAVKNQGTGVSVASLLRFYLSTNATLDSSDQLLGSTNLSNISAGSTVNAPQSLTVPRTATAGSYYLVVCVDSRSAADTDTSNDCSSAAFTVIGETVDLTVTGISGVSSTGPGGTITPTAALKNQGTGGSTASLIRFYLSANATLDPSDTLLGSTNFTVLASGATGSSSLPLSISKTQAAGSYYVLACIENRSGSDTDTSNDCSSVALSVVTSVPDLLVTAVSNPPGTITKGGRMSVSDTTANAVGGVASNRSQTMYYLSTDTTYDIADVFLGTRQILPLVAGQSSAGAAVTVLVPRNLTSGTYYLLACADGPANLVELDESNNCLASGTTGTAP